MSKIFESVRSAKVKKNKFDLSHERKMSLTMGKLYPMLVQEVVPGDKFRVNTEILTRMAPMIAPIMHRLNVYTHYFFVPNRLVWSEWEDFITGGRLGDLSPVMPYIQFNATNKPYFLEKSLADYMGFPAVTSDKVITCDQRVSALPFRAYQLIYDEFFRDQNLMAEIDCSKASGAVTGSEVAKLMTLRYRAWEKDYFTSALPWSQRGGEAALPLEIDYTLSDGSSVLLESGSPAPDGALEAENGVLRVMDGGLNPVANIDNLNTISGVDLPVNEIRKAIRLQEWLERTARGGARYIEQVLSHFGVRSSDARLQRPEYLGGGKNPMVISEVLNTVGNDGTGEYLPQGNMAGHGVSVGSMNGFSRHFEEHGFIIGIVSILPKTAYQQGLPRLFSRENKFDYYWPEFAHLGEQEILKKELFLDVSDDNVNYETFGYQSRYSEYKYQPSTVHGDFRTQLQFWHLGRVFATMPPLNELFVMSNPSNRIFAVTDDTDKIWMQMYHKVDALRPMPFFGTPIL